MRRAEDGVPARVLVYGVAVLHDEDLGPGLPHERLADVAERVIAGPIAQLQDLKRDQQAQQTRDDPDRARREPTPDGTILEVAERAGIHSGG